MRRCISNTIVLVLMIASGCSVGPNYHPPKVESIPQFGGLNGGVTTNEPVADWWRQFHDPELDHLIDEALKGNLQLQMAAMRIRESRAQRNLAAADLFPVVDADPKWLSKMTNVIHDTWRQRNLEASENASSDEPVLA